MAKDLTIIDAINELGGGVSKNTAAIDELKQEWIPLVIDPDAGGSGELAYEEIPYEIGENFEINICFNAAGTYFLKNYNFSLGEVLSRLNGPVYLDYIWLDLSSPTYIQIGPGGAEKTWVLNVVSLGEIDVLWASYRRTGLPILIS